MEPTMDQINVTASDITLTTTPNLKEVESIELPLTRSHYIIGDLQMSKENPKGDRDFKLMVVVGTFDLLYLLCTILLLAFKQWEWGFVFLGFHVVENAIVVILETFSLESYYQLESVVSQMKYDAPLIQFLKVNKHSSLLKKSWWEDEQQEVQATENLGIDEWKNSKDDYQDLEQVKDGLYAYMEIDYEVDFLTLSQQQLDMGEESFKLQQDITDAAHFELCKTLKTEKLRKILQKKRKFKVVPQPIDKIKFLAVAMFFGLLGCEAFYSYYFEKKNFYWGKYTIKKTVIA